MIARSRWPLPTFHIVSCALIYLALTVGAPLALADTPAPPPNLPLELSAGEARDTERIAADVAWLAADARQGRGIGTAGLDAARDWLVRRFALIGLKPVFGQDQQEPAADGIPRRLAGNLDQGYLQAFEVPIRARVGDATEVMIDGQVLAAEAFAVAPFSNSAEVRGEVVVAGYGITAEDIGHDDYEGIDATGKIVAVRRFTPAGARFDDPDIERRYGDLRYKAYNAREHGAIGLIVVDLPRLAAGETMPDEARLPGMRVDAKGDAGLPVVTLGRASGASLFDGAAHSASLAIDLEIESATGHNVVGLIKAGAPDAATDKGREIVVIGAHYDHLGFGENGSSLTPDSHEPHNGADDNASGTAGMLDIARRLMAQRAQLRRDVLVVAFSGEESGLVGSTALTRQPPPGISLERVSAMINLDMIGRLEDRKLAVLGAASAEEWQELVPPLCERQKIECRLGGDGYGPSDQTPFYAAGVPVLHFFTGTHDDYHKVSDDADKVDAAGVGDIAQIVAELLAELSSRQAPLTYVRAEAPAEGGDMRSFGASLGTIPDYVGDDRAGVLLAGARPGSAADKAGITKGDLLVELAGREIRDIYDFVFVLRQSKPGQRVSAVVVRGDERLKVMVTFDESKR